MHEVEDGGDSNSCSVPRLPSFKSVDVVDGGREQAPKLCGYLNKLSGKGPLRGYKLRWFVYDPRKCYLYYFKTPQDALPLGHIDIGDACFMYDVEGHEGQFEVRTAGKEFLLKVENFVLTWRHLNAACYVFFAVNCHFLSFLNSSRHTHSNRLYFLISPLLCVKMKIFQFKKSSISKLKQLFVFWPRITQIWAHLGVTASYPLLSYDSDLTGTVTGRNRSLLLL